MSEIAFQTVTEAAEYLAGLEQEIVEIEKMKQSKMSEYRRISSQILGAPTFGELTSSKLIRAIQNIISFSNGGAR